jgi:hypothetical protein
VQLRPRGLSGMVNALRSIVWPKHCTFAQKKCKGGLVGGCWNAGALGQVEFSDRSLTRKTFANSASVTAGNRKIVGHRLNSDRLNFVQTFVFPPSHMELLPVREAKKEQAEYEAQMTKENSSPASEVELEDGFGTTPKIELR